jgi:hypothetical protein
VANVVLRFMTQGYGRVKGELGDLDRAAERLRQSFGGVSGSAGSAGPPVSRFFSAFTAGASSAVGAGVKLASVMAQVTAAASGLVTVAGGLAAALGTKLTRDMLMTADAFEQTRVAFAGLLGSDAAANKMVRFVDRMTSKMPGTAQELFQALKGFAAIPAFEGIFKQGDERTMEKMLQMITGMKMLTGRSFDYIMMGLRQGFGGGTEGLRSLERYLDIPIEAVAQAGKTTMKAMAGDAMTLFGALNAYFEQRFPSSTLEKMNRLLTTAIENVGDLVDRFYRLVAASGVYDLITEKVNAVADALRGLLDSEKAGNWAAQAAAALSGVVNTVWDVLTRGVDWGSVETLGDLGSALRTVARNAVEAFREFWDSNRERISSILTGVVEAAAEATKWAVKEIFLPVGRAIGEAIVDGLAGYLKEHPIEGAGIGALGGAFLGAKIGGPWGALAGALAGAGAGFFGPRALVGGASVGFEEVQGMLLPSHASREAVPGTKVISLFDRRVEEARRKQEERLATEGLAAGAPQESIWAKGFETPFERAMAEFKESSPFLQALAQLKAESAKDWTLWAWAGHPEAQKTAEEDARRVMERVYLGRESKLQEMLGMEGIGPGERMEIYKNLFQVAVARKDVFGAERFYENYMKEFVESMKKQNEDRKEQRELDQERNQLLREIRAGIARAKSPGGEDGSTRELNKAVEM